MKLTQIILEDWKPSKYTTDGETTESKIAGSSDNLEEFLRHLDKLPVTIESIKVPINTKAFKTGKDYKVIQPSPGFIGDIKELVTDLTKQYEEKGEKVTSYDLESYSGLFTRDESKDAFYIQLRTKQSDDFGKAMSRGDFGSLD